MQTKHTFRSWLNANPGMATTLGKAIKVKPATISNVKHGHKPIPTRWIPQIVSLSKGQLSYKSLVDARVQGPT